MEITIYINDAATQVPTGASVAYLLEREGIAADGVAVAAGGRVISRALWDSTVLTDGLRLTIIRAVCGG